MASRSAAAGHPGGIQEREIMPTSASASPSSNSKDDLGPVLGKEAGDSSEIGTLFEDGSVYKGDLKDGKRHGKGACRFADGGVYDGDWKDNVYHGTGTLTSSSGTMYDGEWKEGGIHGKGTMKYSSGANYEGMWTDGNKTHGTMTLANGYVYEGGFKDGLPHGWGTTKFPSGNMCRKLRSERSRQRRLEAAKKTCEQCGVDDYQYKLRTCSACNLALYCSAACQKAARGSHQRICSIVSELPPRDGDRLILEFDEEKNRDFDAGLRYATKYMHQMKHLEIDICNLGKNDAVKLSAKRLSSLLRSKAGALDSAFWVSNGNFCLPGITINGDEVWKELHGLKQLRLNYMQFVDVQSLRGIIDQQRNALMVLCLQYVEIGWHKAKCRRIMAQAVDSCNNLVRLDLDGCVLMDSDLKVMLQNLPNLRILYLKRHPENSHEFTDNTCGLIARKCPGLQALNLYNHDHLSVRGIRKIFEGCVHLRSFYTTSRKLSCDDVCDLLGAAPQLLHLHLNNALGIAEEEMSQIIEETGGRTVLCLSNECTFTPDNISAQAREKYERQRDLVREIWSKWYDPEVVNVWADVCDLDDQGHFLSVKLPASEERSEEEDAIIL